MERKLYMQKNKRCLSFIFQLNQFLIMDTFLVYEETIFSEFIFIERTDEFVVIKTFHHKHEKKSPTNESNKNELENTKQETFTNI